MVFPAMATTEQISCRGAYRLDMSYIIGVSPILFITIHHFIIDAHFFEVFHTHIIDKCAEIATTRGEIRLLPCKIRGCAIAKAMNRILIDNFSAEIGNKAAPEFFVGGTRSHTFGTQLGVFVALMIIRRTFIDLVGFLSATITHGIFALENGG